MKSIKVEQVKTLFTQLKVMAAKNRDYLIELDGVMGDSDLGITMEAAFIAADEFSTNYSEKDIGALFMKAGMMMAKAAPSTMGTLMATGFMRGGKALKGAEEMELSQLHDFWDAFVHGLMERGKAKPGEKTIVDALYPVVLSLKASVKSDESMVSAMKSARDAAHEGMQSTKTMVAQHGRAAYYQEKSREIQDPGATVGYLVADVFSKVIES